MEFSPHTLSLLCWGSLAASHRNSGFQNFLAWRLLFPQRPGRGLLLTTHRLFHCALSLLAGLPYGHLGLRFMPVLFGFGFVHSSKQLGPFTGRTAVAVSPGEAGDARENIGVTDASEPEQRAWARDGGAAKEETGMRGLCKSAVTGLVGADRVQVGLCGQTLGAEGRVLLHLTPEMEVQGLLPEPLSSSRHTCGSLSQSSLSPK